MLFLPQCLRVEGNIRPRDRREFEFPSLTLTLGCPSWVLIPSAITQLPCNYMSYLKSSSWLRWCDGGESLLLLEALMYFQALIHMHSYTKVYLVKAMVFPVAMYGCESWTIKKAEHRRIDAFELWCWRGLLRVPWTARRSSQSILKEISPEYSLEGLKLKHPILWLPDTKNWLIWKDPDARKDWRQGEKGMTEDEMFGWYHWLNGQEFEQAPGSWWWTGRPGMLQSIESQRARHDWATEPNWYTSAVDNQCSCLSYVQITMWLNTLLRYFCIDAAPSVSLSVKWGPTVAHAPPLLQKALDHKYRYFRRAPVQEADQNFHVGLQLCSSGHQSFNKLIWIHHSCHITYK